MFRLPDFNWHGKGVLRCPSLLESAVDRLVRYVEVFTHFRKAASYAIKGYNFTSSRIARLLLLCCPPYVPRFVIPVHIDALKRFTLRYFSHVVVKRLKGISPRLANSNSAPPVVLVSSSCGVFTPANHRAPASIFCGEATSVRRKQFAPQAPTRSDSTRHQVHVFNDADCTAVTPALAPSAVSQIRLFGKNKKSGKSFSDQVEFLWHIITSLMLCNWRKLRNSVASAEFYTGLTAALSIFFLCSCASRVDVAVRGVSLYATGEDGKVYVVEQKKGDKWVPVSNLVGSGTNAAPEFIVNVPPHTHRIFRFRPE